MDFRLTPAQRELRDEVRSFVAKHVTPFANAWDRDAAIPSGVIASVAEKGWLGAALPTEFGGLGMDQISLGILHEEIGRGCSSLRSLLTVHHNLVAMTIARWGTAAQKERWLHQLASGEKLAAFALSEPGMGSDAAGVRCRYRREDGGFQLDGVKTWITFSQLADLFLVFAREGEQVTAFLVERALPGVLVEPIDGMMGTRASHVGKITFDKVSLPDDALFGREGLGFLQVANTALDYGRYSVACGSLGILRASLEAASEYANSREAFGQTIGSYQLVRRKLTLMTADYNAGRLLCRQAGWMRENRHPDALMQTNTAKYFCSKAAMRAALEAVQIHGAAGCHDDAAVQRYFRDAKVMEIIEGTHELQENLIGEQVAMSPGTLWEDAV